MSLIKQILMVFLTLALFAASPVMAGKRDVPEEKASSSNKSPAKPAPARTVPVRPVPERLAKDRFLSDIDQLLRSKPWASQALKPLLLPPPLPENLFTLTREGKGCWKSDQNKQVIFTPGAAKDSSVSWLLLDENQIYQQGVIGYYKQNTNQNYATGWDICASEDEVIEFFCAQKNSGETIKEAHKFSCPAGTQCQNGACTLIAGGCLPDQEPFLKFNGAKTHCTCPPGFVPIDKDGNLNSDECVPLNTPAQGLSCDKLGSLASTIPDSSLATLVNAQTGAVQDVINYCAPESKQNSCNLQVSHLTCSPDGIMSQSSTNCSLGEQCLDGTCVSVSLCDGKHQDSSASGLGYILIGKGAPLVDYCDNDPLLGAITYNYLCNQACGPAYSLIKTPCPEGTICDPTGLYCKEFAGGDGINCEKTPDLPECGQVDCEKTPDLPECFGDSENDDPAGNDDPADKEGSPDNPPDSSSACKPDFTKKKCSELSDPQNDAKIFGEIEVIADPSNLDACSDIDLKWVADFVGKNLPPQTLPDKCSFDQTKTSLAQYACVDNKPKLILGPCAYAVGLDCDPKAESPGLKGICKPFNQPVCSLTGVELPASNPTQEQLALFLASKNSVQGQDGFGHPFSESDSCENGLGFNVVKKWSCTDDQTDTMGAQGHVYSILSCPKGEKCEQGACVPLVDKPVIPFCDDAKNSATPACHDNDGDSIKDQTDNCPNTANAEQKDADGDGLGDVCDSVPETAVDSDGDGIPDNADNCPLHSNGPKTPGIMNKNIQLDSDADGLGDVCDTCQGSAKDCGAPAVKDDTKKAWPVYSCTDTDPSNNTTFPGTVSRQLCSVQDISSGACPNPSAMEKQNDFCVSDSTLIKEVNCGPLGGSIVFIDRVCDVGKSCDSGVCQ